MAGEDSSIHDKKMLICEPSAEPPATRDDGDDKKDSESKTADL